MTCCLVGTYYLNQCWIMANWAFGKIFQWNLNQNTITFNKENLFQSVVWKMSTILSRPQYAKEKNILGNLQHYIACWHCFSNTSSIPCWAQACHMWLPVYSCLSTAADVWRSSVQYIVWSLYKNINFALFSQQTYHSSPQRTESGLCCSFFKFTVWSMFYNWNYSIA